MSGPTNPTETYFDKGLWGHDGTLWRKLNLLWGYYDRWAEDLSGDAGATGEYSDSTVAVPSGYVYVAKLIFLRNISHACSSPSFWFTCGGVDYFVSYTATLAQYIPVIWNGEVALKAGDQVGIYVGGCTEGDDVKTGVLGYKMKIA